MSISIEALPAFISPKQFAEVTGFTQRSVTRLCNEGRIPAQKIPGSRLWRIKSAALKDWMNSFSSPVSASNNVAEGAEDGK